MKDIHGLLEMAIRHKASDVVIKAGSAPALRVYGKIVRTDLPPLSAVDTHELVYNIIASAGRDYLLLRRSQRSPLIDDGDDDDVLGTEALLKRLEDGEELDLSFTVPNMLRVRANLYLQRGCMGAALRIIPLKPLQIEELGLPLVLRDLANQPQGLVLVTGPTGSGKSTTLAAMIDYINSTRPCNIVTIEDPVEYLFEDNRSIINQREIGTDTRSFSTALTSVLRQTPDVIMIGEMRDAETMSVAMAAAEVGHLVLSTLHTTSAANTVERIISAFPPHERSQVQIQLATSLQGVISQKLITRADGRGRVPAVEVMIASPTVKKQIEDGTPDQLYASIREGQHFGMNTMNQALANLYYRNLISYEDALAHAGNYTELKQMLRRV
ncbi:MAG TPA: type IV pilus twitching motility protein PilT [Armatimonadota bacterium]|nr:type IV pilus twitching motility protein PilT [Armatimonadota bacterium]HPO74000.1 type IV pilus twitching motility protein PilT [Armatimonadota bacterium]HPT97058.1 type IV pilus twitching motility protein PilT [Armatimonadota bacterium]